jgi:hypothetical protein
MKSRSIQRQRSAAITTLQEYVRHAELFGTECVYETALEEGHGPRTLARLRVELDSIEASRKSRRGFTIGKRRRRPKAETRAAVEVLSLEGLVPSAIAHKLGISEKATKEHLRALRGRTESALAAAA